MLGFGAYFGGRALFNFSTNVRIPACLLQEVEIGGKVHLSPERGSENTDEKRPP